MEQTFSSQNQQKSNNQSFQKPKEFNQNNFQTGQNKNIQINKDSYLFLHSKKFLNKIPNNNVETKYNNNFQSLSDYIEPQPQIYQNLNINNNQYTDYQSLNIISGNNNNNINFSNQPKNKKLLEEYFKLKNVNNNYNYYTYNNHLYKPNKNNINSNKNNNKQIPEPKYNPLSKRQKIQKNKTNPKNPITPTTNPNKKISHKNSNSLSKIYQPEKNIKHSPSFTPIKKTIPSNEKNSKSKDNIKQSPYFGSKSNSNSNIDIAQMKNNQNNLLKPNIYQNKQNVDKIIHSEETERHIKSIIKNKNFILQKEKDNKKKLIHNPQKQIRKNLTPTRKEVQTCFGFGKNKFLKKGEKNYGLYTNLTSTSYNNISSINSTESYWRKKENEKRKKMEQIKTERILKEEKELQEKPKINKNSKRIMTNKYQNKIDVFDRLSDLSQIQNHNAQIEKIRERFQETHTPVINNNSRRMKRTIEDLYNWKNKKERKKMESAKYLNKINRNKIVINPQSEEILREKKSDYINKKVEDRLLEQGRLQQYKNEIQRERYLNYISKSKKYTNNEYMNIHSRYLESPNSSKDNNIQKGNKSCDRIINKGNRINYRAISLNNNMNINSDGNFDYINNNYYNNKNDINYMNNMNQNRKDIYYGNNNGSNLINGNINNYIINNNYNNNYMLKPLKNQIEINDNIKNNHYQYFPNYNSVRNSEINQNYNYNLENNNNINKQKKNINFHSEKATTENKINNQRIVNINEQNDIINIRKHLNEFYENKKNNNNIKSNNLENYLSKIKDQGKDESLKNGLLKGLLDNGNEQNFKNINNENNYKMNNNININQNMNSYNYNNQIKYDNIEQSSNKLNSYDNISSYDKREINSIKDTKQKYNFKPELLKDIHKIPKSSGINFDQNKHKNLNYFQFQFDRNENNNNKNKDLNIYNENNIQKPYEYIQNNANEKNDLYNDNNIQINNKENKYSIEDSVNINNLVSNANMVNNNNYQKNNNLEEMEKERRKQDLLQMINFSSNLKLNSGNNNYINNDINNKNIQNNNNYEDYNIVQSYEDS